MPSTHDAREEFLPGQGDTRTADADPLGAIGLNTFGPETDDRSGKPLLSLLSALLRQRRFIAVVTGVIVALTLLSTVFRRQYTATAVFMPQLAQRSTSALAGLAAQFGMPVVGMGGGDNIAFYAELPTSRELLRDLALTEFRFAPKGHPADTTAGALVGLLGAGGDSPQERLHNTIDILGKRVAASPDLKTGLVTLEVTASSPELAELMTRRVLDLLNDFNMRRRQSQAGAERRFIEDRMRETRRELDSAEASLEYFLEQNRRYQESPRLAFLAARLQRRIDLQQQVYTSLAKLYEDARIEEVRNTPVITIVDRPEDGARRAGGGLFVNGLLAIVLGGVLSTGLALARDGFQRQRKAAPGEYEEFVTLWHAAFGRLLPGRPKPSTARH